MEIYNAKHQSSAKRVHWGNAVTDLFSVQAAPNPTKGEGQQNTEGNLFGRLHSKLTGNPCTRHSGAVVLYRDHTSRRCQRHRHHRHSTIPSRIIFENGNRVVCGRSLSELAGAMQSRIYSRRELPLTFRRKRAATHWEIYLVACKQANQKSVHARHTGAVVLYRDHTSLPTTQWRGGRGRFEIKLLQHAIGELQQ